MQGHLIYLRSLKEELEKKDFTPLTRSGLNEAIDAAIDHAESMLEKEKERMCEFAFRFNHDAFNENYIKAEFEETFNNK